MHLDRTNTNSIHRHWNKQVKVGDYVVIAVSGYTYPVLAEVIEILADTFAVKVRNPYTNRVLARSIYEYTLVKDLKDFDKTHPELFI